MTRSGLHTLFLSLALLLGGLGPPAAAADSPSLLSSTSSSGDEFLPPDVAFKLTARAAAADKLEVNFIIADGYYLYRDKLKFAVDGATPVGLGKPELPLGKKKNDEYFGDQVVYYHELEAKLPISRGSTAALTLPLKVTYQGCADAGLCYPPITKVVKISLSEARAVSSLSGGGYESEQDTLARLIREGNLLWMVGAFFLSGLLLAFTPCVLPMVPIVSGIIAGQGKDLTRMRGFALSLTYVLGMAATYTGAGIAVAAAGQQAQTLFQQPWIIILFALLFVAMAVSMFGFFTVQMPAFVQTRIAAMSNQQRSGSYVGVAVMGALSALIVTTCVGPALVAALTVIGQTGQMARGGVALFAMAIGMGVPLLIVGASAGQLLPRAGAWMDMVKQVVGAMMLAVAVWMLSRILPERVVVLLWALPCIALAIVLLRTGLRTGGGRLLARGVGVVAAVYALLLIVGGARGAVDPLAPWQMRSMHAELPFRSIKSLADLQREVAAASAAGRPVMLDFYADWCVSCKEMEKYTFTDPSVRAALANAVLLRADVTANDEQDQALLKHFSIFGPPTIAFYASDGSERSSFRVVGYMKATDFASVVLQAVADPSGAGGA
ncbi:MAG: protein-disulfide reductase DsbD [Steroidobacteraceae bacterium]